MNQQMMLNRATMLTVGGLATVICYSLAVAELPIAYPCKSILALTGGMLIGASCVVRFILWMESDCD